MTTKYIVFSIVSVVALIGSILTLFLYFSGTFKKRTSLPFQPAYLAGMGLFLLANISILLPVYAYGTDLNRFQTVFTAVSSALQEFTINLGAKDIFEITNNNWVLNHYLMVFFIFSPILTIVALLSLMKDFFTLFRIKYLKHKENFNIYAFSKLTLESITLAKSIQEEETRKLYGRNEKHSLKKLRRALRRKALFIFCDVQTSDEELYSELIEQANDIQAVTLKKDITLLNIFCDIKSNPETSSSYGIRWFFAIGENETENESLTLVLNNQWQSYIRNRKKKRNKTTPNTRFFVFSTSAESEYLFDKAVRENLSFTSDVPVESRGLITRVNELRSLVYNRLYLHGSKMFLSDSPDENGNSVSKNHISRQEKVHAVIIGAGGYGTEMVKALPWYCHMNRNSVHIDVYDKDSVSIERLRYQCPSLFDDDKNGAGDEIRQSYQINLYDCINVFSAQFDNEFESIEHPDYVLIALGTDNDNISAALHIRILCERMGIQPKIEAIIKDTERADALCDLGIMIKNKETNSMEMKYKYDIDYIGDIKSCYSYENILMPELNKKAYECHTKWATSDDEREQFYVSEYCYRSSLAAAIRQSSRKDMGFESESVVGELTAEELEHIGWWEWMLSEGFQFNDKRNDLAKHHNDMKSFMDLPEVEKEKDRRMI